MANPQALPDNERTAFEVWAVSEDAELSIAKIRNEHCNIEAYASTVTFKAWQAWQTARATAAPVPEGYVLAPIKPTFEMVQAAENVDELYKRGTPEAWKSVYREMLAASPKVPL